MNWQDSDVLFGESSQDDFLKFGTNNDMMVDEMEEKKSIQLQKFQNPANDLNRQAYITLVSTFGDLLVQQKAKDLADTILTDDCQIFHLSSTGRAPVKYASKPEGFLGLYEDVKIIERKIRETYVDLERSSAFQICNCKVHYKGELSPVDEVTFEAFTIRDGKISKYRVCFAEITPAHGGRDPFEPTRKDRMLAKVKQINYALAGKPNFEKVASLLHDDVEYKLWSWGSQKCSTIHKGDFAASFRSLEKEYGIETVVPYEVSTDREFIVGNYVYHLEGRLSFPGQKFVWLSTCVYAFDEELNIIKVNQQGELFLESEAPPISFEVYPRDRIVRKVHEVTGNYKANLDVFYQSDVHFSCDICQFGRKTFPDTGCFKGMTSYTKALLEKFQKSIRLEWVKMVDVYIDHHDPSYDVAITFSCSQGSFNQDGYDHDGRRMNFISLSKWGFENEKLSKFVLFLNEIPDTIPSPFDDLDFEGINIKKGRDIM